MKTYFKVFLLFLFAFSYSCKSDKDASSQSNTNAQTEDSYSEPFRLPLYDPCVFISVDEAARIVGVDANIIQVRENQFSGDFARSCNLRWTNMMDGNEYSIIIIMQSNPLPGELDDYSGAYINAKLESGDRYPGSDNVVKYVKLGEVDFETAFQHENFRLYWKANNDYTMSVYMSSNFEYNKVKDYMLNIARIVNKNINNKLK